MSLRADVLIAGGGIGGLTAALALARAGQRVIVAERAAALATIGAGVQLSPNATRRLRELGLLPAIEAVGTRSQTIRICSARTGRTIVAMPIGAAEHRWGAPYLVIRRADLQGVLAEAIAREPAIELLLDTTVAGFGVGGGGVEASLKQAGISRSLRASVLVGADGIRSEVRRRLCADTPDEPLETGRTAWRALVDATDLDHPPLSGETTVWLGHAAHLVSYPVCGGTKVNVVATVRGASVDADWAAVGDKAVLAARFAAWPREARQMLAAARGWTTWPLFDRAPLPTWHAGYVALLGDAAHPILPFLAQGAAQAIEDAFALAECLGRTGDRAHALAAYTQLRSARARRVQDAARRLGRAYHLFGPAAVARDAGLRAIGGARLLASYDWLYGG